MLKYYCYLNIFSTVSPLWYFNCSKQLLINIAFMWYLRCIFMVRKLTKILRDDENITWEFVWHALFGMYFVAQAVGQRTQDQGVLCSNPDPALMGIERKLWPCGSCTHMTAIIQKAQIVSRAISSDQWGNNCEDGERSFILTLDYKLTILPSPLCFICNHHIKVACDVVYM